MGYPLYKSCCAFKYNFNSFYPVLVINVDENNDAIPLSDDEPIFFDDTFMSESISSKLTQLQREGQKTEFAADFDSVFDQLTKRHMRYVLVITSLVLHQLVAGILTVVLLR